MWKSSNTFSQMQQGAWPRALAAVRLRPPGPPRLCPVRGVLRIFPVTFSGLVPSSANNNSSIYRPGILKGLSTSVCLEQRLRWTPVTISAHPPPPQTVDPAAPQMLCRCWGPPSSQQTACLLTRRLIDWAPRWSAPGPSPIPGERPPGPGEGTPLSPRFVASGLPAVPLRRARVWVFSTPHPADRCSCTAAGLTEAVLHVSLSGLTWPPRCEAMRLFVSGSREDALQVFVGQPASFECVPDTALRRFCRYNSQKSHH